jgi:hypothetical protein
MSTDNLGILRKKRFIAVPPLRANLLGRYSFLDALSRNESSIETFWRISCCNRFDLTVQRASL